VRVALKGISGSNPALKRISVCWFVVNLAEWAYITVITIHEFRLHGALALGLIGARYAVAAVFGSMLLGFTARRRPTLVLRLLSGSRCVVVATAGLAVAVHAPLIVVAFVVWLDAVVAAPYRPVQSAVLPALAGTPRELSAIAGSVPASKALAQAAGALAGSLALSLVAPQGIVWVAAALFGLTALIVGPLRPDAPLPVLIAPGTDALTRRSRLGAIGTGFELISRRARPLLYLGGARSLTRGLWTALTVVASLKLLHLGTAGVGVLMAAAGVGAAIAVPLSLRFAGRPRLAGPGALAFALAGVPVLLVGIIARPAPAIALIVLWGAAFALADSISNALIHRVVEARLLAPSVAAIESSKSLLEGVGALLAPALLALLGVRTTLIVAGAPLPLLVLISRPGLLRVDRNAETRTRPLTALRRTPSFRGLTMLSLENLASRLQRSTAEAGQVIVTQGEEGDRFYLIDRGTVEVTVDGFRVTMLGAGGSFGEKALLRSVPRSATVTSLEPTSLWSLDGADFVAAATGDEGPVARRVLRTDHLSLEEVLANVPMFGAIDRHSLAGAGTSISVAAGTEVVREGEPGDDFYVLLEGEAAVAIKGVLVRALVSGDWFGEIALLHSVPRTATVTATTKLDLWKLGRVPFLRALDKAAPLDGDAVADSGVAGVGLLV